MRENIPVNFKNDISAALWTPLPGTLKTALASLDCHSGSRGSS